MSTAIENNFLTSDCYWFSTSKNISSNEGSRPQALVARGCIYTKRVKCCQQIIKLFQLKSSFNGLQSFVQPELAKPLKLAYFQ